MLAYSQIGLEYVSENSGGVNIFSNHFAKTINVDGKLFHEFPGFLESSKALRGPRWRERKLWWAGEGGWVRPPPIQALFDPSTLQILLFKENLMRTQCVHP